MWFKAAWRVYVSQESFDQYSVHVHIYIWYIDSKTSVYVANINRQPKIYIKLQNIPLKFIQTDFKHQIQIVVHNAYLRKILSQYILDQFYLSCKLYTKIHEILNLFYVFYFFFIEIISDRKNFVNKNKCKTITKIKNIAEIVYINHAMLANTTKHECSVSKYRYIHVVD